MQMKNVKYYSMGRCRIIVSTDNGKLHLSISCENCSPSYKEIKEARYKFLPDNIYAAQIFPPKNEFVNLHEFTHHLWEIDLPDGQQTGKKK